MQEPGLSLTLEVKEHALGLGVDSVGVASAATLESAPSGHKPSDLLPGAKSVIVLSLDCFDTITGRLSPTRRVGEVSFRDIYNVHQGSVYGQLDDFAYQVGRFLVRKGYRVVTIPSSGATDNRNLMAVFSHKHAAAAAGLGTLGLNGLVVTPAHGQRARFVSVITDAPLSPDASLKGSLCPTGCDICIKNCPSGALQMPIAGKPYSRDAFKCCSFYGGSGGCGICMASCPVGASIKP